MVVKTGAVQFCAAVVPPWKLVQCWLCSMKRRLQQRCLFFLLCPASILEGEPARPRQTTYAVQGVVCDCLGGCGVQTCSTVTETGRPTTVV